MTIPSVDDSADRERIANDLDTNLLVEAGAGSGKTRGLVDRMLALIARGTRAEQIAAVTFTRKATSELRERFEERLEQEARTQAGAPEAGRFREALAERDRTFIGTIHSFCGRLLREHPLEAGLDPSFEEVDEEGWALLVHDFWSRWLEQLRRRDDQSLAAVAALGIDARSLADAFAAFITYPDVEFPAPPMPAPDPGACRRRLLELLEETDRMMPAEEPAAGYDALQRTCRRLGFWRTNRDWSQLPEFAAALLALTPSNCKVTQNRWPDKQSAKALGDQWLAFLGHEGASFITGWREHCYAPVIAFLSQAAEAFRRERFQRGTLGFEDLLLGAVRLLRTSDRARRRLGERFRHLLVDEFQDTDPIQAELCFLLASEPSEGGDWRQVRPRPGALFVVGDPKQSIYRFRRADIQAYEMVKRRMEQLGAVLRLTSNFRSVHPIARLVDGHFVEVFPEGGSGVQAPFAPLATLDEGKGPDGVYWYWVTSEAKKKAAILDEDAARVASLVAARLASGDYQPGDFLILAMNLKSLASYARELSARNIPVSVTGAPLRQEEELRELLVILRALADPANPVRVVAALEGLFCGLSLADLDEGRARGLRYILSRPPAESGSRAGQALGVLHDWWRRSRDLPPDLLVEHIIDQTGLLPWAAGLPLGDARAGALLHLVDLMRTASGAAGLSLPGAIELVELALQHSQAETPLRPGRQDVVRVMNLHKAKGLQSRVVILVAPIAHSDHAPVVHVRRSEDGTATGGLVIQEDTRILAQPAGWAEMAEREAEFTAAERQRLLYVATTRAEKELIVSRLALEGKTAPAADRSFWSPLAGALQQHASFVELPLDPPPGRQEPAEGDEEMAALAESASVARAEAARVTYRSGSVTRTLKDEREARAHGDAPPVHGKGKEWGALVHACLHAMGQGREGEALTRYVEALVWSEMANAAPEQREDVVVRLEALLAQVRRSSAWQALAGAEQRAFELPMVGIAAEDGVPVVMEGVADAAALVDGEWRVVDWKTDSVDDRVWSERLSGYQRQVDAYAGMIARRAGVQARGTVVRLKEA